MLHDFTHEDKYIYIYTQKPKFKIFIVYKLIWKNILEIYSVKKKERYAFYISFFASKTGLY